ncbi:MAG: magnesium transporter CorA family protein [Bauldia sp.]|nr:magnesium transporter CorA family protein [Bauldia sp.]
MLTAYDVTETGPKKIAENPDAAALSKAHWIDIKDPTHEEDRAAERFLGVPVPTAEEASEIEFSSRFYVDGGAVGMTATILSGVDLNEPALTPFTFVLHGDKLATVRYADFVAFRQFMARSSHPESGCDDPIGIVFAITEAIIDRLADVVEKTGAEIDKLNGEIFRRVTPGGRRRERRLEAILTQIGNQNDIVSKARESIASLERMIQFITAGRPGPLARIDKDEEPRLKLMQRDIRSLSDQTSYLSNKTTFLLDATLGLISVQQNEVIRILTVAATILLPPTLIGTIYGMNFTFMPELDWPWGYPLALGLMAVAALIPFVYLKRRGWF